MIRILLALIIGSMPLFSVELDYLYKKNVGSPETRREKDLVAHAKNSFEKALARRSKLTGKQFATGDRKKDPDHPDFSTLKDLTIKPYYHLINNLCELEGATHLHVGLLAGDSLVAALYGNQSALKKVVGLDWFQECPRDLFESNCRPYIDLAKCTILNEECFNIDKSLFGSPVDIYLYDADHSLTAHEKAITYYDDAFAEVCILVIDDWECPWIRKPTFKGFDKMGYRVLYQDYIRGPEPYRSGQYLAVIKKN